MTIPTMSHLILCLYLLICNSICQSLRKSLKSPFLVPTYLPILGMVKVFLIDNDPFKDDEDFVSTYDLDKSFISMVSVDVSEYLGSQEPIKKTLTIPRWADKLGREMGLNFYSDFDRR